MIFSEARNEIQKAYLAVFDGQFPIALDNQDFTPPDSSHDPSIKWIRLTVVNMSGKQYTLGGRGNRKFQHKGMVTIQVFTPKGSATNTNDTLCQDSLDVFEGERIHPDLWLYDGSVNTAGSFDGWYQQNVDIDFSFVNLK